MTVTQLLIGIRTRSYRCYYRGHTFEFVYRNCNEFDMYVDKKMFQRFPFESVQDYYDDIDKVNLFEFLDDIYFYRYIINTGTYYARFES